MIMFEPAPHIFWVQRNAETREHEIQTPPSRFLCTSDLVEMESTISRVIEPRKFSYVGSHQSERFSVKRLAMPCTEVFSIKSTASIRISKEKLNSLQVSIPLKGAVHSVNAGSERRVIPGEALIHKSGDDLDTIWSKRCLAVFVHVEPRVLAPLIRGISKNQKSMRNQGPRVVALTHGLGKTMASLLNQICSEAHQANSEVITDRGVDRVLHYILSLILAQNQWVNPQDHQTAPVFGKHLDRAVEFVFRNLENDISLDELAEASFVSARTLQRAFVSRFGVGPICFIKRAKLSKAREELMDSSPTDKTVSAIASKWGFHHAGNFARIYSEIFNETPVQTLRQSRVN